MTVNRLLLVAAISHQQALDRLRANTKNLAEHVISWSEWDREVERILDLRYPGERVRPVGPRDGLPDQIHSSRMSSTPDTRRLAASRLREPDRARGAAPDAP